MKFAMEIPIPHLEELSMYTQFDFPLTHIVEREGKGSTYVNFYRRQAKKGRMIILDNSFNELGGSLSQSRLLKAALMINATHIVVPDAPGNYVKACHNILQCRETIEKHKWPFKVFGVWHGGKKHLEELTSLCDLVGLPYHKLRDRFVDKDTAKNYHFLGFRSLDEIRRRTPGSLDTSMPVRAALYGIDLTSRERRPRTPLLNIEMKLTKDQLKRTIQNVELILTAANGDS